MTGASTETPSPAVPETGFGERWNDRLNPILVKEVRQALRGRYFKISFWITLCAAAVAGLALMVVMGMQEFHGGDEISGQAFFVVMFACLAGGVHLLVPFSAFLSMGGEWDENTFDLLVLSNLKPRQIVLGKILSAGVQALLFYSAFGPFLVFAFLLRGVDLTALLVVLAIALVASLLFSCLAVAMSSFTRVRFARVVLMVLLAVTLVFGGTMLVALATQLMMFPGLMHQPETFEAIGASLTITVAVTAYFFAAACSRLAHPEENRSTGLRVMSLLIVLSGLGWMTWTLGVRADAEMMLGAVIAAHVVLAVTSIFFVTEAEPLGRRVAAGVPRNRGALALVTPFLPGGATGLLFYLLGGLTVAAWAYGYPLLVDGTLPYDEGELAIPLVLTGYGLVFLGLPGGIFSSFSGSIVIRTIARVSILLFFVGSILLPSLIGFFLQIEDWMDFEHPGNIFLVIDDLWSDRWKIGGVLPALIFALALTAAVNAPRMVRAIVALSRARRARVAKG